MASADKNLFLGGRLKRLRRDLGVTQAAMAEELKVSASYLNLLERNQRPVTAQVLLRLAEAYDLDLRTLAADEPGSGGLDEVLADRMFADLAVSRHEVAEVAEGAPGVAEAFVRLYRAYLDRGSLIDLGALDNRDGAPTLTPTDWVRDLVIAQRNHFADLEEVAARILRGLRVETRDAAPGLRDRLQAAHGVRVRVMPVDIMGGSLRRYDYHRKQLLLAETLAPGSRTFAMAYQIGLLEAGDDLEALAARFAPPDEPTRRQLKVFLGNYLAGAILMPYEAFLEALEATQYDIEAVRPRFGVSFEQASQRLTSLGRPGERGIPFFMVRVDAAGNVSKRYSNGPFPFSRFGGTCPRWNIHDSFKTPGRIITQVIETPDGSRYFTIARTVRRVAGLLAGLEDELAIGLGCELKHAGKLIYARGLDMAAPAVIEVGPACRICERRLCPQRAAPPVNRSPLVEEGVKSISSFPFAG
jgi:predicted transcriptional regulator/transcriptional regulator with XRE-family HTH domain